MEGTANKENSDGQNDKFDNKNNLKILKKKIQKRKSKG